MTTTRIHRFLGDDEYSFDLAPQVVPLEKRLDLGIGEIAQRVVSGRFHHRDLIEIIRFALIGAGTSPEGAKNLIEIFVDGAPVSPVHALANEILSATWDGAEPEPEPAPAVDDADFIRDFYRDSAEPQAEAHEPA